MGVKVSIGFVSVALLAELLAYSYGFEFFAVTLGIFGTGSLLIFLLDYLDALPFRSRKGRETEEVAVLRADEWERCVIIMERYGFPPYALEPTVVPVLEERYVDRRNIIDAGELYLGDELRLRLEDEQT